MKGYFLVDKRKMGWFDNELLILTKELAIEGRRRELGLGIELSRRRQKVQEFSFQPPLYYNC